VSGELQGAGGVGGLLYLTLDDEIYIPLYDGGGNVTKYIDASGNIVASYTYGAFGQLLSKSGPFADVFRFRFSTKYYDAEIGLYYYGYRFYSTALMRWLNRDPIGEEGGLNLYGFCGNNAMCRYDGDGRAYFIKRSMFGLMYLNAQLDEENQEWAHEQLIFEDGGSPSDVEYFNDSSVREDPGWRKSRKWVVVSSGYNDCVMRKAVNHVPTKKYKMTGDGHYNCQDFASDIKAKYDELIKNKKVRCECGLK
jgi:RHS repeat-associated protein